MTGQTISHYRILDKLGEGGMGVVYMAEDTRLRRTVALKFLPPHAVDNRERFLREAQAAAALSHPNICVVHEIDEQHGFLAMEYIDGVSVKDKIAARPLPLEEAFDIATQACAGLQAAHEKGIVHRDVKPANLMVTSQGQVKIMDFGLAQVGDRTRITKTGSSLGTPAYMSPEQARGDAADRRSDIWSLGVVLYEMVTGRLPFRGESEAAVARAILDAEPEPLTALRSGLPIALDRLIAKALAKNAADRYQHVDDLLVDLRKLGAAPSSAKPGRVARAREWIAWGAAAVCAAIAVMLWFFYAGRRGAELSPVEFSVYPEKGTTFPAGGPWPAVSPDGRQLAFVALHSNGEQQIWVRPLDSSTARPLQGTQGAARLFWSPDSRSIGYFANGQLLRADLDSGAARVVCEAPYEGGLAGTWADGVILFRKAGGLYRVPATGGPVTNVAVDSGDRRPGSPSFLPDGRRFLYLVWSTTRPERSQLCSASLDSQETTCFSDMRSAVRYAPPGYLLYIEDQAVVTRGFDARRMAVFGDPVTLSGVQPSVGPGSLPPPLSISSNGALAYPSPGVERLVWLDRSGTQVETVGRGNAPAVSPDGRRIAFARRDAQTGNTDLWLYDRTRGKESRFTFDPAQDSGPVFSSDGEQVLFTSQRSGINQLYQKPVSGAGEERLVASTEGVAAQADWSSDGRFILYQTNDPKRGWDLWAFSLVGDRKPFPVARTEHGERAGRFSPDVRWVAYDSTQSGRRDVWVQPFPPTGSRWQVSTGGGVRPRWRGDGKELYYVAADGMLTAVPVEAGSTFETGAPLPLFQTMRGGVYAGYAPAHDGKRFLINVPPGLEDVTPITVVLNWTALLRK